ncbi:MAG: iron-sulfur cluster assembly scaffold protein [Fimbriimonadaceae bacterium]|nr:iron-sulfur cluster assembly scaffold protein [Fimbriimonadaceae bacterium]
MFSPAVLDHFYNPRNAGPVEGATHYGQFGIPGDGPYVRLWLAVEGVTIARTGYETYGCPAAVGCASVLAEVLRGKTLEVARLLEPRDLELLLGGLPDGKGECADRAIGALRSALEEDEC